MPLVGTANVSWFAVGRVETGNRVLPVMGTLRGRT